MHKWKAVCRDNRASCFAGGKYCKFYHKDTIVEAEPGTLGLMVFDTKKDALDFSRHTSCEKGGHLILEVQPIGKGKRPMKICSHFLEDRVDNYYAHQKLSFFERRKSILRVDTIRPPKGTICYPAVKVLT